MAIPVNKEVKDAATIVADTRDADILLFNAGISRRNYAKFLKMVEARQRRQNLFLMLFTEGGDADAAYKLSRLAQNWYTRFVCFLPGYCKSAGTIVVMGAHELVINDDGEMGPVDIQMAKKDELAEYQSGLTVLTALTALHEKAYLAWEKFFFSLEAQFEGQITLKTAAHIASQLTTGLFSPVYSQIDPMQLGETVRAMSIGTEYGKRLNSVSKNLRPNALEELVAKYPDHGFVIDLIEAKKLFYRVDNATKDEQHLFRQLESYCDVGMGRKNPTIEYLNDPVTVEPKKGESNAGNGTQSEAARIGVEATPAHTRGIIPSNGN